MTNRIGMALLVTGVAIAVVGCTQAPEAPKPPTQDEAQAIVDKAEAVWNSADTARIMALYAIGAVMFDPVEPAPTHDRDVQTKWTDAFTAMKASGLRVPNRRVQVLDADTIVSSGTATIDATVPEPRPISIRYTDVYQKQVNGSWLIVHEHLSEVPKPPAAPAG